MKKFFCGVCVLVLRERKKMRNASCMPLLIFHEMKASPSYNSLEIETIGRNGAPGIESLIVIRSWPKQTFIQSLLKKKISWLVQCIHESKLNEMHEKTAYVYLL